MLKEAIPAFNQFSASDKLTLLEELWDDLTRRPDELPVPAWQQRILDERYAEHQANPSAGLATWEEAKARILKKL